MTLALLILSGFIILLLKIVSLEKYLKTLEKDIKQGFSTQDDFSPLPPPLPHHHPPPGYVATCADISGFLGLGRKVGTTGI